MRGREPDGAASSRRSDRDGWGGAPLRGGRLPTESSASAAQFGHFGPVVKNLSCSRCESCSRLATPRKGNWWGGVRVGEWIDEVAKALARGQSRREVLRRIGA